MKIISLFWWPEVITVTVSDITVLPTVIHAGIIEKVHGVLDLILSGSRLITLGILSKSESVKYWKNDSY